MEVSHSQGEMQLRALFIFDMQNTTNGSIQKDRKKGSGKERGYFSRVVVMVRRQFYVQLAWAWWPSTAQKQLKNKLITHSFVAPGFCDGFFCVWVIKTLFFKGQ